MKDLETWRMLVLMGITASLCFYFYRTGLRRGKREGYIAGRSIMRVTNER